MNEGLSTSDITLGVRLLGALDVKKILFVSPMCSVDFKNLKLGDIGVVQDHVVLCGRNALFGPNEERWGTRFPDITEAYSKKIREIIISCAKDIGMKSIPSFSFANVIGPIFGSFADSYYAKFIETQAMCISIAQEVIVARHMQIDVGVISLISCLIDSENQLISILNDFEMKELLSTIEILLSKCIIKLNT
jgi:purine-nucleoside phosphorylase